MTENKHASEETVEETAARIEADTATDFRHDTDTEKQGKHLPSSRPTRLIKPTSSKTPKSPSPPSPSAISIGRG